ncbi:phenylpropionate dioxygenase ferredoxin reductase subunit [Acinetobacter calcoaceticus]|uniref:Phenylpropionate dioxygenase ferredoxin reductase subunit n=1 Tax=Acinetobacter calcoaceticus TaxID=471 RepID=A0A4R1Y2A7_ACICA|nr:phenylpropionate dioxygenase ferredoxin reductase subunit [Acinetobacter calcoaceticus]
MNIQTIIIVGAGQAGASAVLELRAQQYTGQIILIGEESHLPYERPPLSKEAILNPDQCKLEILSADKLAELEVEFIRGQAVLSIDAAQHQLHLQDGRCLQYDKLLLATGGSPRRLPAFDALGKQVYTLRNLEDAHALISVLQPDRRIVLIGGGVIGLELASSARAKGCQVTLLEQGSRLMGRSTPEILADFLYTQHRHHGVDIRLNSQILDCQPQADQILIQLDQAETLLADAVIYGIGIQPNTALAVAAGLKVDAFGAVLVNADVQSSDPDIYAAGDIASQLRDDGVYRRVETWENANLQAAIFARHVMQVAHPKANPAWFWTDQLGVNFQFAGDMGAEEWYVRGEINPATPNPIFILFGIRDRQIVAAITVNAAKEMRHLKKMIQSQQRFATDIHLDLSRELRKLL